VVVALASHLCLTSSHAAPPFPTPPHPSADARYTSGPDAQGAELKSCADLSRLDQRGITLYGTDHDYCGVNFNGANLSGASLEGADILSTKFNNCAFRNAIMRRLEADWVIDPSCDLTDADIGGASIRLTAEQLQSTKNYKAMDLSDTTIMGDLAGVSFRGFNLRSTTFAVCDLTGCDFTDAEIWGMSVYGGGAYDRDGRWTGSSNCVDSQFSKEQLYSTRSYQRRDLDCVQFHRCNFRNADFSNQTLGFFCECDLEGAVFTNAGHITGAGDSRHSTCMSLGSVSTQRDSPPIGFEACNLSTKQFYSTRIYATKKLQPGCRMERMDLKGWDFCGFDLRYVRIALSNMANANLDNARSGCLELTVGLSVSQVKSMWNFRNDRMHLGPEFSLPRDLAEEFAK